MGTDERSRERRFVQPDGQPCGELRERDQSLGEDDECGRPRRVRTSASSHYDIRLNLAFPDTLYVEFRPTDEFFFEVGDAWSWDEPDFLHGVSTSMHAFEGQPTFVRFGFSSNGSVTDDGAYRRQRRGQDAASLSVQRRRVRLLGGTSEAAPHVSGVAALVLAQNPGMTVAQLKDRILTTVDPLPSLAGKTVTGGRLNAFRALGGDPPTTQTPSAVVVDAGATRLRDRRQPRHRERRLPERQLERRLTDQDRVLVRRLHRRPERAQRA